MGLRRRLSKKWDELVDGTLTGPGVDVDSVKTGDAEIRNLGVRAGLNGEQSTTAGTDTKLQIEDSLFDDRNELDSTENKIILSEDGKYAIFAQARTIDSLDGDTIIFRIRLNGNLLTLSQDRVSGAFETVAISDVRDLNSGDELELFIETESDDTIRDQFSDTYVMIQKEG